ncbi:MAG: adenylate/guanylate cyclase domain-containing protein [Chloroflexi bacterium]|nr:adenylate/guanylate cyclase domain-containing protein [Chloroflexota bacterium]
MFQSLLNRIVLTLSHIGRDPADSDEVRLPKTLLVICSPMVTTAAALWGLLYVALGEWLAGSIPLSYTILSLISIVVFARTHRYHFFRFSQLLLILLLPFLLMITLGGFINSSAVIIWSLLSPLGALVFDEPRRAWRWFVTYVGLVALSGLLQPFVRLENHLSPVWIVLFFVMNIGAVCGIAFVLLYYFVGQKETFLKLLHIEQEKSENLLLNVLPKEVALILKNETRTIANQYDHASVLYADLVGFTPLTAEMAPVEMVDLLNEIFSHFDSLVEKHDLEKIRTIGDNYMVASGVPRPRPDHAQAAARAALEMSAYIQSQPPRRGKRVDFRIGINSGPLIAGVIGRKKFQYDLWGDMVNTASRMESQGTAGQIQITRNTYELIKDEFICEPRGTVLIKGKGEMETWYLVGTKAHKPQATTLAGVDSQ